MEDVLLIHYVVIDEYFSEYDENEKEQRGVKSKALLFSALNEPRQTFNGKDLYPTILHKAATYLRSFACNHSFHNGNKRTGIMTMITFLEENGYEVVADKNKLVRLARLVVIKNPSIETIVVKYLKKYVKQVSYRKFRGAFIFEYKDAILKWAKKTFRGA